MSVGIPDTVETPLRHRALVAVLGAMFIGGCASGAFESDQPYQQLYVLPGLPARAEIPTPLLADLSVAQPQVRPGLDTDRIAVVYPDRRLDYFAASRWSGSADAIVQSLLIESLRNSAGLRSVQGDVSTFAPEYVLQTEITDFQAEYGGEGEAPQAHVQFLVTVGRFADRRPLVSFVAAARVPAESNTLSAVVAAFEQASHQAAATVVDMTRSALAQAQASAAASDASR
jgi:cholesterol transport system auxiliary component